MAADWTASCWDPSSSAIDHESCGCCYCGMFPPHSTHSKLLLVVSSSILPSSKTKLSVSQMVLIITIVSPAVLMATGFLSFISNVWNPLLAPTTPFSGGPAGCFWLMSGIAAGVLMMKQNLNCSTPQIPHSHSLLTASCGMRWQLWGGVWNWGYRSSLLTMLAHLCELSSLFQSFVWKKWMYF